MNSKTLLSTTLIAAALLGTVATAEAGHPKPQTAHHDDNRRGHAAHYRDTAKVIDVEPIVSWRQVEVERRVCKPRRGHHNEYSNNRRHRSNDDYLVPTVLGGVVGGVIGSQVNDRGARVVTTAAGSAVGAMVGYGLSQVGFQRVGNGHHRHGRHCRTVTEYERRRHVDGYRVTYRYRGHQFVTRTDEHPGRRIPVRVKLRPDY
jgi:uncharacterized protein YcfJ